MTPATVGRVGLSDMPKPMSDTITEERLRENVLRVSYNTCSIIFFWIYTDTPTLSDTHLHLSDVRQSDSQQSKLETERPTP